MSDDASGARSGASLLSDGIEAHDRHEGAHFHGTASGGGKIHQGQSGKGHSGSRDIDPPWATTPWYISDDNLNILIERRKEPHQALHREALETIL